MPNKSFEKDIKAFAIFFNGHNYPQIMPIKKNDDPDHIRQKDH